jgi:hypothetical protein
MTSHDLPFRTRKYYLLIFTSLSTFGCLDDVGVLTTYRCNYMIGLR